MAYGQVATVPVPAAPSNILSGSADAVNTAAAQPIITIPAGRTWYGTVTCSMANLAATGTSVSAAVATAGTGVTPAVGTVLLKVICNTVGTVAGEAANENVSGPLYVVAPSGNAVTLTLTNSTATTCTSTAQANGQLL